MSAAVPLPHGAPVPGFARAQLAAALERVPAARHALAESGDLPLAGYVRRLAQVSPVAAQPAGDLVALVSARTAALLGPAAGARAAATLEAFPAVLTANHHGVDSFAQSLQGTLALALGARRACGAEAAAVVLACAAVPLNNLTFPRGLLGYAAGARSGVRLPVKIPVFPDRYKRDMVCRCAPFDADMLARARARVDRLAGDGSLHAASAAAARNILDEDYGDPAVLALHDYSSQATVVNARVWRRLFREPDTMPALACLALEDIAAALLARDLADPRSLAHAVLLDAPVRDAVVTSLDGAPACWDRTALSRRAARRDPEPGHPAGHAGSVLFWGLDAAGRRVPLDLVTDGAAARLAGVTDAGQPFEVALDAESLGDALKAGRILPTLFTSYLCIAMARNVSCLGGYYQADYLPRMQRAVVCALGRDAGREAFAVAAANAPTTGYLSGLQAVMHRDGADRLLPAGPLEIAGAGGLDAGQLERMERMSVMDAHLGSTVDTVQDVARELVVDDGWHLDIAADLAWTLTSAVVLEGHARD